MHAVAQIRRRIEPGVLVDDPDGRRRAVEPARPRGDRGVEGLDLRVVRPDPDGDDLGNLLVCGVRGVAWMGGDVNI